ncbi:MAG: hypothetical protein R6U63_10720, partial [Longimicrobiales bacterium]
MMWVRSILNTLILAPLFACDGPVAPPHPKPVEVVPIRPSIEAGGFSTCSLDEEGAVLCWGYSNDRWASQSERPGSGADSADGYPFSAHRGVPQPVLSAPVFARVVAAASFHCGLTEEGRAYCWGRNDFGQLGDGTRGDDRWEAMPVATDLRFERLASPSNAGHMCGLTSEGEAYCWGHNGNGQLGAGSDAEVDNIHPLPVAVAGNHRFQMLAMSGPETCGLTSDSLLYCWGRDFSGLTHEERTEPTFVPTPVAFDTTEVGDAVICGLAQGKAYCRGWNGNGVLGTGDTESRSEFTPVATDLYF